MLKLANFRQIPVAFALGVGLTLSLWGNPSLAGDPFRSRQPRLIGDQTEATFVEMFKKGDYNAARELAIKAVKNEPNEPLAHALRAGIAFIDGDQAALKDSGQKTLETANALVSKDSLRGNLYLGVGHFLQGAYMLQNKDQLGAASKLGVVFEHVDKAAKISPDDPELNLIKGYLDLLLAVYLPFSKPEQAIQKFKENAAPDYLVFRGIGSAYRDLKQYDKALQYLNRALSITPDNPELLYLKGQVLLEIGSKANNLKLLEEAEGYLSKAEVKQAQLPKSVQNAIRHDKGRVSRAMTKIKGETSSK